MSGPSDSDVRDELELRALVGRYAQGADAIDGDLVAQLFVEGGRLRIHDLDPEGPRHERTGRAAISAAIGTLDAFEGLTHMLGQSLFSIAGDRATGETYCQAHHLFTVSGERLVRTMWIRYQDDLVRQGGNWRFDERVVVITWTEDRPAPPVHRSGSLHPGQ